jgi:hypothetical protein
MIGSFKSFLSEMISDPKLKASLEQEKIVTQEVLFDLVNKARKL